MGEFNKHEKWGDNVGAAYREQIRLAKEANTVPYGQERLTTAEAKARWSGMSVAERQKFIAENGREEVIRSFGGK